MKDFSNLREKFLGVEFDTTKCGKCFVIDYKDANNVLVAFYDNFCMVKATISSLRKGLVLNPNSRTFYKTGFIGLGKYSWKDSRAFILWKAMLRRCYSICVDKKLTTYKDITVCEQWLNFQNFAEWCYNQTFFNAKDENGKSYCLDKDILVKGNKIYSPETCCFVPQKINKVLLMSKAIRGDYPIGVSFHKQHQKFKASISLYGKTRFLGYFSTVDDAFNAYKIEKELYIKLLAQEYVGKIDAAVLKALTTYELNIYD